MHAWANMTLKMADSYTSDQKDARSKPTRSEPAINFSISEEENIVLKKRRFQKLLINLWNNLHLLQLNLQIAEK